MNCLIKCFVLVVLAAQVKSCSDSAPNGFCTSSYYTDTQRNANCALTCGLCVPPLPIFPSGYGGGVPTPDCEDSSDYCPQWASTGYCTSTSYSISQKTQYCAKTCGLCPLPPMIPTTPKPDPSCYDSSESCAYWQTGGFCTSPYYSYEQRFQNCAKTCGLCKTTTTTTTTLKPTTTKPKPTTTKRPYQGYYGK